MPASGQEELILPATKEVGKYSMSEIKLTSSENTIWTLTIGLTEKEAKRLEKFLIGEVVWDEVKADHGHGGVKPGPVGKILAEMYDKLSMRRGW